MNITIFIPACNEEANIRSFILSILQQEQAGYNITKIIIISDGSEDNTVQEVRKIKDKRINIIAEKTRRGKPFRMNQAMDMVNDQVLVQLDADIVFDSKVVLAKLLKPMMANLEVDLVFGKLWPLEPISYIEKVAYFGFVVWDNAKIISKAKTDRYYATGTIRALSTRFINGFKFPDNMDGSEDSYMFYYAMAHSFKIKYVSDAVIYFKLPNNAKDYSNQLIRTNNLNTIVGTTLGMKFVNKYESINQRINIKAIYMTSKSFSIDILIAYLYIQTYSKIRKIFIKQNSIWTLLDSTKVLNKYK